VADALAVCAVVVGGAIEFAKPRRTAMKLATIALASAFALSSTFAIAQTSYHHHKQTSYHHQKQTSYHHHNKYKSARTYQGTVGMGSGRTNKGSMGRYGGSSNDRGGLVGGADPGTYKP
jgi:hypothetical protein